MSIFQRMSQKTVQKPLEKAEKQVKLIPEEQKVVVDSAIRQAAMDMVCSAREACNEPSKGCYPSTDIKAILTQQGEIDKTKLEESVFHRIVGRWDYNDRLLLACRAVKFDLPYVAAVIATMDLSKAIRSMGDLEKAIHRKFSTGKYQTVKTKDVDTGEIVTLKIPLDEENQGKLEEHPPEETKKNPGGESAQGITEEGKPSLVGKRVYFTKNKDQPVMSGQCTGHGKQGITVRDDKNAQHQIQHGFYTIHKEDEDYGSEDYGEKKEENKGKVEKALPSKPAEDKPLPTGAHRTPPKGYPKKKSQYGIPSEYKYPLDTEKHVRAAMAYFSKHQGQYEPHERVTIWKRILQAAKKFGIEASPEVKERAEKAVIEGAVFPTLVNVLERPEFQMALRKGLIPRK